MQQAVKQVAPVKAAGSAPAAVEAEEEVDWHKKMRNLQKKLRQVGDGEGVPRC